MSDNLNPALIAVDNLGHSGLSLEQLRWMGKRPSFVRPIAEQVIHHRYPDFIGRIEYNRLDAHIGMATR